jgi:hypothetical protein
VALSGQLKRIAAVGYLAWSGLAGAWGQEAPVKPAEKPAETAPAAATEKKTELPFQIQVLETHIRFEANGDSRKEVHTIVKINNNLGARQFARISFDYNRSFQQVEIPLVRISHVNGGTSEVLPSAVTDAPNPAVEQFPAYQDVRMKSVRILGLQEGDTVEYRVITTTTKHPLAPDFWLERSFDRSGQVLEEHYDLDLPASRQVQTYISPSTPPTKKDQGEGDSARVIYKWSLSASTSKESGTTAERTEPDVVLTTYSSWEQFATRIGERLIPNRAAVDELGPKAKEIARQEAPSGNWIAPLYDFVSQKIKTVDLPLGATGLRTRPAAEILSSGYGTPEDKFALFAALVKNCCRVQAGLVHTSETIALGGLPRPNVFDHLLARVSYPSFSLWMDLNLEVAPFGMIPSQFRSKPALLVEPDSNQIWRQVPKELPVTGFQKVAVDASLDDEGKLTANVRYTMRGDNELLLRVAFHQTVKDKWKDVANLLALSDGFRGQVTSVETSDPMETKEPFTVEYELTQAKFVDWAKKPVRIPALLPQIGLPDPPRKAGPGEAQPKIELGTPLEVQTSLTLHLPTGTAVQTPAGTTVTRDYATFTSKYSATQNTVTASRHINFLKREIPGERATDYNAFLRAVQNDQSQVLVLAPPSEAAKPETKP